MQRIVSEYCWFKSSPDCNGGLAERLNAPVLKTGLRESVTGVRIPEPPHLRDVGKLVIRLIWDEENRRFESCHPDQYFGTSP